MNIFRLPDVIHADIIDSSLESSFDTKQPAPYMDACPILPGYFNKIPPLLQPALILP